MDIFEYAMQMEKDGEYYYRQSAQQTTNKGLKTILTMLADEELKHCSAIKTMETDNPQMTATTILADAKNVFIQLKEVGEKFDLDTGQLDFYKKAREIEEKSRGFYLEKADEVEEEFQKELFIRLAEEEKKHYFLLDNIIAFISRPEQWLENAEFCHLEEY